MSSKGAPRSKTDKARSSVSMGGFLEIFFLPSKHVYQENLHGRLQGPFEEERKEGKGEREG